MEVLGPKLCLKHNLEAHKICTSPACFEDNDILVCPNCSTKHNSKGCQVLQVTLLNDKVHELMKKRLQFQGTYHAACEEWLNEFRKFKVFKQQLMSVLNIRQRHLNDICRKIRRTIPYEKDKQLFKKSLGYLYLSTRAISPNYDLYQKYRDVLADTISDCNRALHKLRIHRCEIPLLLKKENQICAILKQLGQVSKPSITPTNYIEPTFSQFKKQTIRYNKAVQAQNADSKLYRVGDAQFIAYNNRSQAINLYNKNNMGLPKTQFIGSEIDNLEVLGKNVFMTNESSNIFIYDLLNQKLVKEYASSNHKHAKISALLAIDRQVVLNFIHNPNQIVALSFDQHKQTLKVVKGEQIKHTCLTALNLGDQFVGSFDDKKLRIYNNGSLEKTGEYEVEVTARSLAMMDQQTILAGGESQFVELIDRRAQGLVGKFNMQRDCLQLKKIYPTTFIANMGTCLRLYEFRMQKELIKLNLDSPIRHIEVLSSLSFVTSGKQLSYYEGIL